MSWSGSPFYRLTSYLSYEAILCVWLGYVWTTFEGIPLKEQFHDVRPIQHAQEAHIGIAAFLYLLLVIHAFRNKIFPEFHIYFPILCVLLWGTNRELDGVWERHELDHVYDSLKFVTAIPAILFVLVYRKSCLEGLINIRNSKGFQFLVIAIGGYLAAQLIGKGIEALDLGRTYKRATEESLELLLSACFIFSAIEASIGTAGLEGDSTATESECIE